MERKLSYKTKKIMLILLIFVFTITMLPSCSCSDNAADKDFHCELDADMNYLSGEIGQRVGGTPNEKAAAEYIAQKFKDFGYKDTKVETFSKEGVFKYDSVLDLMDEEHAYDGWQDEIVTSVGRIDFKDGLFDIYGKAYPDKDFGKVEGQLVDFGTYPDIATPDGINGPVIGVVRFTEDDVFEIVDKYEWDGEMVEDYYYNLKNKNVEQAIETISKDFELKGILVSRDDGKGTALRSEVSNYYLIADVTDKDGEPAATSIPCISTTGYLLDQTLENASQFSNIDWIETPKTHNTIATKPAPGGDPDAIIIVSAHMDSVLAGPGANDNATGSATLIELARRLADVDLGNIEVRFVAVGGEEDGFFGSIEYVNNLSADERAIAVNLNMDMVAPLNRINTGYFTDVPNDGKGLLDTVSQDIWLGSYDLDAEQNLAGYLVTGYAKDVPWNTDKTGIENVRIFNEGWSDHVAFTWVGLDASSMIFVRDSDDDIESGYHSSQDNLKENYCHDTHHVTTALMENAILKAAELKVTKYATFSFSDGTIELANAEQLFNIYDSVSGTFVGPEGKVPFKFTPEKTTISIKDAGEYKAKNVIATATGTADNKDAKRNKKLKDFTVKLAVRILDK